MRGDFRTTRRSQEGWKDRHCASRRYPDRLSTERLLILGEAIKTTTWDVGHGASLIQDLRAVVTFSPNVQSLYTHEGIRTVEYLRLE